MPRLFFDAHKTRDTNSGLGQYSYALAKALVASKGEDWEVIYGHPPGTSPLHGARNLTMRRVNKYWRTKDWNCDVWHVTHQMSQYLPSNKLTPLVLTIHDLNFLAKENYSDSKMQNKLDRVQRLIDRASLVVYISQFTKSQCEQYLNTSHKKSHVIYNGNPMDENLEAVKPQMLSPSIENGFLLIVGRVDQKKNLMPIVQAMPYLDGLHLVVTGNTDSSYAQECKDRAKELGVDKCMHFTGEVSESEKLWLYRNCSALLMPSLSEGFGLPVIEAISEGKVCILSPLGALPEVGGALSHYLPHDFNPQGIATTIGNALADLTAPERRKEWASQFSWEKAAQGYWRAYEEVLGT